VGRLIYRVISEFMALGGRHYLPMRALHNRRDGVG
jgi:hypothetical protein